MKAKRKEKTPVSSPPPAKTPSAPLCEVVIKKRVPIGIGPEKIAAGKAVKIPVQISYLSYPRSRFTFTRLLNTGASKGLFLQRMTIAGKDQFPTEGGKCPISLSAFEGGLSENEMRFHPAHKDDEIVVEIRNTTKEDLEFSMTLFGRFSELVEPVNGEVKNDKTAKIPLVQKIADAVAGMREERLVDPELVAKLFTMHAARFLNDLTSALVEAAEAAMPQPATPDLAGIREAMSSGG